MNALTLLDRVKQLCENRGISLSELERRLNFSQGSMTKWDSNIPSAYKISQVANFFSVSTDYLIGRTNITETAEQALTDPDIITIQRLRSNLSIKNREKMMQMLKLQFSEDFPED